MTELGSRKLSFDLTSGSKEIKDKIDIAFDNISYSVRTGIFKREKKNILREMSGNFKAGELTAIMGQSGAGKTMLMDILSAYTKSCGGQIYTNGTEMVQEEFKDKICYIMQDDLVQPLLTVAEALRVSAQLKLGNNATKWQQEKRINELIIELGLEDHRNTRGEHLSGGQKKRLAIGLEIVAEPPVIFLDEPTSGLDSSAALQLLLLLRKFAHEGKTVIITCHQPSGRMLSCIDNIYCVSSGRVVYTGSVTNLVSYLLRVGIECPPHYNPAENLMENCYEKDVVDRLVKFCDNGKSEEWKEPRKFSDKSNLQSGKETVLLVQQTSHISTWTRINILASRSAKILVRDFLSTWMALLSCLLVSFLIGSIFYRIGYDASNVYSNFRLICISCMFTIFTAFNSVIVKFPLEMSTIRREHFNRWYSPGSYYIASLMTTLPLQALLAIIYGVPVYFMTDQPREVERLLSFLLILAMLALAGTSIGLFTGACFNVQHGMIMGCIFMIPWLVFSGIFLRMKDAPHYLQWLFTISYIRYGVVGLCNAIFTGRGKLRCESKVPDEITVCPFSDPKYLMSELDIPEEDLAVTVLQMSIISFTIIVCSYVAFKYRLSHRQR